MNPRTDTTKENKDGSCVLEDQMKKMMEVAAKNNKNHQNSESYCGSN